ncbi:esterase family protein [Gordonia sp. HY285]|uniref:alpha/beta hydrolase n=1 Tax=Gordonia liuliyuniae TaxID=2911517 RepID=UPI001F2003F5|nr:alpha/beta hydrolase family protein [Gordonia liuliyuniae]MCF8609004.1 esterase family protein [Gordonia liuliyuniae]
MRRVLRILLIAGLLLTAAGTVSETARVEAAPSRALVEFPVYSPSMHRTVMNNVLPAPGGGKAPVLYLLHGAGGGSDHIGWEWNTRYREFLRNKDVTVVSPVGGAGSFYTDWRSRDRKLGLNKWQTYLTRELLAAVNRHFGGNGRNAIAGVSMSGGPAIDLAARAPRLYRAAASYSGCPAQALGFPAVMGTVIGQGGNPLNMWTPGDYVVHDPVLNAARLRGKAIYISAGDAGLELPVRACSDASAAALRAQGIRVTSDGLRGEHSWDVFEAGLRQSWRVIGPAIGA